MKVGFDYTAVLHERTGVGQYTVKLLDALLKIDKENSYVPYVLYSLTNYLLHPGLRKKVQPPHGGNLEFVSVPVPFQMLRYLKVPGLRGMMKEYMLGGLDADIIHSNTFCVPRMRDEKKKVVVTVYDLSVLTNPECHKKLNILHCTNGIREAVEYADRIIAISEHTKRDIMKHFDAPEDLIAVTHLAAGPEYHEVRDKAVLSSSKARYGLPEEYILFVGSLEPRKNIKGLLKAYSVIPARMRKAYPLVIAGAKGWLNSDIPPLLSSLAIKESVIFTGYIDSADISAVYSGASLFVYPSLYEGFGLPILEAMSCGVPVVTSNTSSMPEVAGDAALLVDPLNAEELAFGIETVLGKESLRAEMRKKGLVRASSFSWERCAKETIEVYRKVAASPKRS